MDKYKNYRPQNMKLVAESLNQFALFENMEEAKKVFSDMGYDQNSPEWQDFESAFEENTDLAGKYAKWIEISSDGDDEEFVKELMDTIEKINKAKEYEISSQDLEVFGSFNSFKRHINTFLQSKREAQYTKEKEETQRRITDANYAIKKLGLFKVSKVGRGIYMTKEAHDVLKSNEKGQGLYIWTDLPMLYNWDGDSKNLKTNLKIGQYGANAKRAITDVEKLANKDNNQIEKAEEGGKIAPETIASYSGIYMSPKVILYMKNLNDYFSSEDTKYKNAIGIEKEVHSTLRKKGWDQQEILKSTEVFYGGTLQDVIDIINNTTTGDSRIKLKPKEEQEEGISKITNYLDNPDHKEFLLAAKMRYGKNITVLSAIKQLNEAHPDGEYKNCLFITYKPAVFSSLKEDIEKFGLFSNFEVVDISKSESIQPESKKIRIFISSAQYALYGASKNLVRESLNEAKGDEYEKQGLHKLSQDEEVEHMQDTAYEDIAKNLAKLKQIHFGVIVADEYHYGTKSQRFNQLLEELSYDKIVYVSGTAMKDMATGRFEKDQMYNWTYMDEQKQKEIEIKKYHKDPNGFYPNLVMPKMHFYKMQLSDDAKELAEKENLYTPEEGFSFMKAFDSQNGQLRNAGLVKMLLEQIMTPQYGENMSIMAEGVDHKNLNHMFWVVPKRVKNIKALANFMRSKDMQRIFGDYEIIEATGELNNNIDKVKNKIRGAENRKRKSITLSCYRFKEGTTVPEWGAVVMLDDGKSPEEYLQAIFRCQSPGDRDEKAWPEKENCYVFDYNPQRFTIMYHDIAQWSSKSGGTEGELETTEEFLKYAPVLQAGDNKITKANAEEIIKSFHQHASFKEQMANDGVFNFANIEKAIDEDYLEAFSDISAEKTSTERALNDQGLGDQTKNKKVTRTPQGDQEEEDDEDAPIGNLETQKEKIRNFLRTLPTFLMASKKDEKNVQDIINTEEFDLFEEICGVSPKVLDNLVNRDQILSERMMNQRIEYFRQLIIELENNPTPENVESFVRRHMIIRGESGMTPPELVNEMLDKLPEDIWTDPNKTFCDPVCGMGTFLIGIKHKLMNGLKNKYPNEKEREKHIIENMIWGSDILEYKTVMSKILLGTKTYKDNIEQKDILQFNLDDMPKFDVIVGNPPYKRNLHLKFLSIAVDSLKDNGEIIWLQPARWLQDPMAPSKKNSDFNKYKTLPFIDFDIISVGHAARTFSILIQSDMSISHLEKNKKSILDIDEIYKIRNIPVDFKRLTEMNYTSIADVEERNKKDGIRLRIKHIRPTNYSGGRESIKGRFNLFSKENEIIIDGKIDGKDWTEHWARNQFSKSKGSPIPESIKFNSIKEAKNFIDSTNTDVFLFFNYLFKVDQALPSKKLPFMKDYKKPWTNDRFEKYFNFSEEEMNFIKEAVLPYKG